MNVVMEKKWSIECQVPARVVDVRHSPEIYKGQQRALLTEIISSRDVLASMFFKCFYGSSFRHNPITSRLSVLAE